MRKVVAGLASLLAVVFMSTSAAASVDHSLTPGATNPAVTQAMITTTICTVGYTKTVRRVSTSTRNRVYAVYHIAKATRGAAVEGRKERVMPAPALFGERRAADLALCTPRT